MPLRFLFLMVLVTATATAKEIRAQVFIVTKGGQSIKLALAKVYLVNLDDIARLQRQAKPILAEREAHERALTEAAERAIKAQENRVLKAQEFFEERSRRHGEMFFTRGDTAEWRAYKQNVEEAERMLNTVRQSAAEAIEEIRTEVATANKEQRKIAEALAYSAPEGLPTPSLTDADGEFSFASSPADVTHVLVIGQRQEPEEFYQWLIPISEMMASPGKYLLSNHNLRGAR